MKLHWVSFRFLLLAVLFGQCVADSHQVDPGKAGISIPSVYTRYLTFPVPSSGIAAEFNPPVLRWPVTKKKGIAYDVRLSQDSSFQDPRLFKLDGTPWAMFNPHRMLEPGTWYWQYRESGGSWSALASFVVAAETPALVSPPAEMLLSGVPSAHPRVLTDADATHTLRSLAATADGKAILADADKALAAPIPDEKDGLPTRRDSDPERNRKLQQDASARLGSTVKDAVEPLCEAWLLSGDDRYRRRAIAIGLAVATWDPEGVTGSGHSDFTDGRCMLSMALVYDTFYDHLTPAQRSALRKAIHTRADRFYKSWINNQEARVLSGHVWQHILHYFFQTAMALHGDDASADDWLSYAYELFVARSPILGGTDGGWVEGASYFRMNMETVLDIPLFIKKYTGFDFIRNHPWYEANIRWMVYAVPPGSAVAGFGDNTEEVRSPGAPYVAYARAVAGLTGNSLAAWYARECERYENIDLAKTSTLRWMRLTKMEPRAAPDAGDVALPTAVAFRDIGLVSMHSNPGMRQNLMIAMRSSPFGCYGHFLADQNCFNILYGGQKIFYHTGYKVTMTDPHRTGWYQHTKSNNGILIDGEGEPYSTEAFGWIPRFISGRNIAYAVGDASNAFRSAETGEDRGVKKFFRHLILLKPDVVVIYDELEAEKPARWSWLIHSMASVTIDSAGNSFHARFENTEGVGTLWSSVPVRWAVADTFDVPAINWRGSRTASGELREYDDAQWHVRAETRLPVAGMRFFAVLRVSPEAGTTALTGQGTDSVTVETGSWRIRANVGVGLPAGVVITDRSGTTAFATHGDELRIAGQRYEGRGPSRLIEVEDGKVKVTESRDKVPYDMIQSILHYNDKTKPNQIP